MKLASLTALIATISFSAFASGGNIPELPLVSLPDTNIQPANPMEGYNPTPISERQMNTLWAGMTTELKDKDCYRRAQIWTWSIWDRHRINSMKVFIHYTNKFNRVLDEVAKESRRGLKDVLDRRTFNMLKYNTTWDYHVAPLVLLDNGEYRVLDKSLIMAYDARYPYTDNEAWNLTKRPATIEEWTEGLMVRGELLWKAKKAMLERDMSKEDYGSAEYNKLKKEYVDMAMDKYESIDIKCHKAQSIAEVDLNHKTAYCFYTIAPMYYYNEYDLRALAFGNTNQPYNRPVTPDTYTEENFRAGAENFKQTKWNYAEVLDAKVEFKKRSERKEYVERVKLYTE